MSFGELICTFCSLEFGEMAFPLDLMVLSLESYCKAHTRWYLQPQHSRTGGRRSEVQDQPALHETLFVF